MRQEIDKAVEGIIQSSQCESHRVGKTKYLIEQALKDIDKKARKEERERIVKHIKDKEAHHTWAQRYKTALLNELT